ncbi:hypothetical protein [Planctomicrobium sp. SH664]|uniref:hypothetical protein n=1 Tax=Planctomicrobium sp. SH664 TaxID=3448125 RepID=UPI003F5C433B
MKDTYQTKLELGGGRGPGQAVFRIYRTTENCEKHVHAEWRNMYWFLPTHNNPFRLHWTADQAGQKWLPSCICVRPKRSLVGSCNGTVVPPAFIVSHGPESPWGDSAGQFAVTLRPEDTFRQSSTDVYERTSNLCFMFYQKDIDYESGFPGALFRISIFDYWPDDPGAPHTAVYVEIHSIEFGSTNPQVSNAPDLDKNGFPTTSEEPEGARYPIGPAAFTGRAGDALGWPPETVEGVRDYIDSPHKLVHSALGDQMRIRLTPAF